MPMGIFARRIEFVVMMRVFDRADRQPLIPELLHEFNDKCRLAVVLAADYVYAFQLVPAFEMVARSSGLGICPNNAAGSHNHNAKTEFNLTNS